MEQIETERLILRTMLASDSRAVFAWAGDERVNRFMRYARYTSEPAVRAWIETCDCESDRSHEFVIVTKTAGDVIGGCGVRWNEERRAWTFGYNLRYDQWGNGYATEAVRAMIAFVAARHAPCVFEGEAAVENTASLRVLEKCGLSFYENAEYTKSDGSATFKAAIMRKTVMTQPSPLQESRKGMEHRRRRSEAKRRNER